MNNIIDLESQFLAIRHTNRLARMLKRLEKADEEVLKNPLPYIKKVKKEIHDVAMCLGSVLEALVPEITKVDETTPMIVSNIVGEEIQRNQKAIQLIKDYLYG